MKIAVVGGGGVRAPLLLKGMIGRHGELPAAEVALFDPAEDKIALLGPVCRAMVEAAGHPFRVSFPSSLEEAFDGATFIITSIRAGGMAARAADERMLLERGLLGQETVGAAGFAKAMRTIRPMMRIGEDAAQYAPAAWIINFTNPVGIVTEAVRKMANSRIVGVCDTPIELFEGLARGIGKPAASLHFDYFGLNHLGWVKRVLHEGVDCLPDLLKSPERFAHIYRHPLFSLEQVQSLGVFPSEYLFYYYTPEIAVANLKAAGQSRAEAIEEMNAAFWKELAGSPNPLATYDRYLARRSGSYMASETSSESSEQHSESSAGYERIALAVMTAIHGDTRAIIPVDVPNQGAIETLEDQDVVEVPCVVGRNGAMPLATGRPPQSVSGMLHVVKHYERLTIRAAMTGSALQAEQALASNPLIADRQLAANLIDQFRAMHQDLLGYLR